MRDGASMAQGAVADAAVGDLGASPSGAGGGLSLPPGTALRTGGLAVARRLMALLQAPLLGIAVGDRLPNARQ